MGFLRKIAQQDRIENDIDARGARRDYLRPVATIDRSPSSFPADSVTAKYPGIDRRRTISALRHCVC